MDGSGLITKFSGCSPFPLAFRRADRLVGHVFSALKPCSRVQPAPSSCLRDITWMPKSNSVLPICSPKRSPLSSSQMPDPSPGPTDSPYSVPLGSVFLSSLHYHFLNPGHHHFSPGLIRSPSATVPSLWAHAIPRPGMHCPHAAHLLFP